MWYINSGKSPVWVDGKLIAPGVNVELPDDAPPVAGLTPHAAKPVEVMRTNFTWLDTASVKIISGRLPEFAKPELNAMREYEAGHRNRSAVLEAIDARLAEFGARK